MVGPNNFARESEFSLYESHVGFQCLGKNRQEVGSVQYN